jgi:hypothetical protein
VTGKEKAAGDRTTKISYDMNKVTVVDCGERRHKLTHNMDKRGDVGTCVNKVDKPPNQVTIR